MLRDRHSGILLNIFVLTQIIGHVDSAWQKTITASSKHPGPYEIQNALDGNPRRNENCRCCAATLEEPNPWYQLDFGENQTINRIHVEGRTDTHYNQHFQGMKIYLKSIEAELEFGEETRITDVTYNVDYVLPVPKSTRYASFVLYNTTRVFTICELTVYGDCTEGTFGGYCESICHCEGAPCNTTTGECPSGKCLPGYEGTACDKVCSDGRYGPGCTESCGNCIGSDICNKQDGNCPGQCASGYQGDKCKQECDDGTYGENCNSNCGNCLNGAACNKMTGVCVSGCSAGYTGDLCVDKCPRGLYGNGCSNTCGNCVTDSTCHHIDGACIGGCLAGFMAPLCQDCDGGLYGPSCTDECGHCLNGEPCNGITGHCGNGCAAGYQTDPLCNTECQPGVYGSGCKKECGNCVTNTTCHHIHGACIQGCKAGFKDPLCEEECDAGFYGPGCLRVCGNCLNGDPCDRIIGYCENGCSDGYQPDLLCKTEIQNEKVVNNYLSLAISGWVCVGIFLVSAVGIFVLVKKRKRANQKEDRSVSRLYEIPTTRTNIVGEEHPYGFTEVNTQDHVYINTESS